MSEKTEAENTMIDLEMTAMNTITLLASYGDMEALQRVATHASEETVRALRDLATLHTGTTARERDGRAA